MNYDILGALAVFAALLASSEVGFRRGRHVMKLGRAPTSGQIGAVQGGLLGLLGLLLGFSFAAAAARFLERQDLILAEANAIGTAYLRADMLDEPFRGRLKEQLARYVDHRLAVSKDMQRLFNDAARAEVARLHKEIWKAASEGVASRPQAMLVVLPPVNEVLDLHATRVAAGRKHLPLVVMGQLVICSLLAIGTIGYGCGIAGNRAFAMTAALAVLVTAALTTTIDLDHSRSGILQLNDLPLKELNLGK